MIFRTRCEQRRRWKPGALPDIANFRSALEGHSRDTVRCVSGLNKQGGPVHGIKSGSRVRIMRTSNGVSNEDRGLRRRMNAVESHYKKRDRTGRQKVRDDSNPRTKSTRNSMVLKRIFDSYENVTSLSYGTEFPSRNMRQVFHTRFRSSTRLCTCTRTVLMGRTPSGVCSSDRYRSPQFALGQTRASESFPHRELKDRKENVCHGILVRGRSEGFTKNSTTFPTGLAPAAIVVHGETVGHDV